MIKAEQFLYSADNFAYVLYAGSKAIAIDPGCPEKILSFLKKNNLELINIFNTHSHYDHTSGNEYLSNKTGIIPANHKELVNATRAKLGDYIINMIPTPGHTRDSICFQTDNFVITGDTLFIANVGNCPTSQLRIFKKSLDKLFELPDSLIIYPGHDYTKRSLDRAELLEPDNPDIKKFREKYSPPPVSSTIGDEKKINPYFRAHLPVIKEHLKLQGKKINSEFACFKSFMELY